MSDQEIAKKKRMKVLYILLYLVGGTAFFIGMIAVLYLILATISTLVLGLLKINFDTTTQVPVTGTDGQTLMQTVPAISGIAVAFWPALLMVSFAVALWLYSVVMRAIGKKFKLYRFLPELFPNKK
jgi:hypothetical protein